MSISRRHLLAKLGLALPAAALIAASSAKAETASGSHRKQHAKAGHHKHSARNERRHGPTAS